MQLISIEKDKQNRPVAQVNVSLDDIFMIKKAVQEHPKFKDPEAEGMRFRALVKKEDWTKLTNINIKDIKEAVNKYIQDWGHPESAMDVLYDDLHYIWKQLNPS